MPDSETETPAPAEVLSDVADQLEEIADQMGAITPETATDTPASETETPAEEAPPPVESPVSATVSAVTAAPEQLTRQLELMRDNLSLVHQKMDHHSSLMQTATNDLRELLTEAKDTLNLHQQVVGEFDSHVEGLGLIAQALAKIHRELLTALGKATPPTSETPQA